MRFLPDVIIVRVFMSKGVCVCVFVMHSKWFRQFGLGWADKNRRCKFKVTNSGWEGIVGIFSFSLELRHVAYSA